MKEQDYIINPMTKGYTQVYTGDGKGKTTAALGLAMRAVGAGLSVFIGEFIKEMEYGEIGVIRDRFPEITVELFGSEYGCIIDRPPSEEDIQAARQGLCRAKAALSSGEYDLVILDELTIPVSLGLLPLQEVLELVEKKPARTELVITGRGAPKELIVLADLVTEMKEIKHYYRDGVLSRRGIEC